MSPIPRIVLALLAAVASAAAGIASFTASPAVFLPGQDVTLTWSVTPGDVLSISPGVGTVTGATGSVTVLPSAQTTYILADSTSGTTAQVTVTPFSPPQLVHRWSFNEASGSTVIDSAASGALNGTIVNALSGTNWARTNAAGGATSPDRVRLPGGTSGAAPYIDLPNGIMNGLTKVTFEGWMTLHGAQNWQRYFDFGTGTAGEIFNPGGSYNGTEYITLTGQVGGTTTSRRLSMKDNNVENLADLGDDVVYGTEFHFAVVYDPIGNNGQPRLSYYKNGTLVGFLNTAYRPQDITYVNNWLGRSNWAGDNNTNASYNEFRVWNGPLSESGIVANENVGPDAIPLVSSFTAFPGTTVYSGTPVRLSYVLNGAGISASIDQGVGAVPGASGFVTVTPSETTTYILTANNGGTPQTSSVTVVVLPGQPSAENDSVAVAYQTATPVALIAHDPNTPLSQLTYTVVTQPAHGSLTGTGATRTYTPTAGYSGPDSFTFKANDGTADSNVATVSITVNPAPVAPTEVKLDQSEFYNDFADGSFAGLLQAIDGNPDDTFTFALVAGAGSTHNAFFTIVGNQLIATHDFSGDTSQTISIRVRVTDDDGNSFDQVITRTVQPRVKNVVINEINYNPSRNTLRGEFVELYNPTTAPIDLGGWRLTKGIEYVFPAGTTIAANSYLVVGEDPTILQALYGIPALGPWTGGLSSDGDEVQLRNGTGATIDKVQFGITSPWPVPPNGDGPSMELLNPTLDNDLGGSWRASTVAPATANYLAGGSPGWHYRKGTSEASSPITSWHAEIFTEDASWLTGNAPIGLFKLNSNTPQSSLPETGVTLATQLTDMATYIASNANSSTNFSTAYRCVFFRKTFTVAGAIPRALLLRVMHNDAAIVWINGTEVARFGFTPNAPENPTYLESNIYERGNDPWSETVLLNTPALLHSGANTIAIQGFAKVPTTRAQQEDMGTYNLFDFCIDAELKNIPELLGTPGAQNSVFAANPPPAIRSVKHAPDAPHSWQPITFTARVSDPQGVGSVTLSYQTCAPGGYIPAYLPYSAAQLLANPRAALQANPAFESAANWTNVTMVDDGSVPGDIPGDGIFTARIAPRPHRTLVRYRITATDLKGASVRIPTADDPRKNFALYVYDGIPPYTANGQIFSTAALTSIPVYQWITRSSDFSAMLAYNGSEQLPNTIQLQALEARRVENWEGALVFNDQVVDHALARLRGGNSRYAGAGKRHFRFKFPKGTPLYAADERGNLYPRPWEEMLFNKMFGNKGYYDFGIPYEVGGLLWKQQGVPMPDSHWVHFRVVQNAAEAATPTTGDFWGLYQALELPEGKNFLRARDLPLGNFYKMSDWTQNGEMDERYQAEGAVDFGEDFDNIRYNIHQTASQSFIEKYVNMPLWYRYNAVQEAIRHYDIFVEPTGRHRVKNLIWYFAPQEGNPLGQLWHMPYDWDASFGPNFNNGWDFTHNALYDHFDITDSPTWQLPKQNRIAMQIEHRNAIRELRDLVWYRDTGNNRGPFDDMLDDALATINAFWPADRARWPSTGAIADYAAGAPGKVADMKAFAFTGWTDTLADGSPAVGAGGRAAYLDSISDALDVGQLPAKPTISYAGAAGFPVDGLAFASSAFSDPQGAGTFSAMQWRVGEITDPGAPAYDANAERIYEAIPVWQTMVTTFNANITVPGTALRVGHTYRARVRYKDSSGRWGHWSAPLTFTANASNYVQTLRDNLMISEVMYHPATPTGGFTESDFEWIELLNISSGLTLDLSNVRFTKGIDFDFAGSAITSLAPGARVLVVKNTVAFASRYGAGKPVAGEWDSSDSLSNSGEQLKLSYGAGDAIHDFTYSDSDPWPEQADAGGYSLVLKAPETHPDHALAANWRASYVAGGTPAGADRSTFSEWATANGVSDAGADDDRDGILNALEYALGGNPKEASRSILPTSALAPFTVASVTSNYLTLTLRRPLASDQATVTTEWSTDLTNWSASGILVSRTENGDATVTEVWRSSTPATAGSGSGFGRVKATVP